MPKIFSIALIMMIMSACHQHITPPHNIDDACVIAHHHDEWRSALVKGKRDSRVPTALILAIIRQESSFRAEIRPAMRYFLGFIPIGRASSAYGYAQVIDSTWQWYQKSNQAWDHQRNIFEHAVQFIIWYVELTYQRYQVDYSDYTAHYLAYHEGHGGFKKKSYRHKKKLLKYAKGVSRWANKFLNDLTRCPL